MAEKKRYIKYTPEELAKVPSPAQKDNDEGSNTARGAGVGAAIGAIAGTLVGIPPVGGAVAGGTIGAAQGAKKDR